MCLCVWERERERERGREGYNSLVKHNKLNWVADLLAHSSSILAPQLPLSKVRPSIHKEFVCKASSCIQIDWHFWMSCLFWSISKVLFIVAICLWNQMKNNILKTLTNYYDTDLTVNYI